MILTATCHICGITDAIPAERMMLELMKKHGNPKNYYLYHRKPDGSQCPSNAVTLRPVRPRPEPQPDVLIPV